MDNPVRNAIVNRDRDCTACRLISGTGLLGAGSYVCYQAKTRPPTSGKPFVYLFGATFLYLGVARLFDLEPFTNQFKSSEKL